MLSDSPIFPSKDDLPRKWISDDYFDLILWYREGGVTGFQLCYGKSYAEHALTWKNAGGFAHSKVDGGEDKPTANRTPVLVSAWVFPKEKIIAEFEARSRLLPSEIRILVLEKLREYSA